MPNDGGQARQVAANVHLKNTTYKDVYVWHTSVERPVTVACTEASTHAQALAGHQLESDAHDRCVHAR
jgi:hypothetical protein